MVTVNKAVFDYSAFSVFVTRLITFATVVRLSLTLPEF